MNRTATFLRTGIITRVPNRSKAYTGPLKVSMNDLPQPCGNFKTNHDALQRKYNGHLIMGIGFFISTLVVGKASGAFYFNFLPPDEPAAKNDYGYHDNQDD